MQTTQHYAMMIQLSRVVGKRRPRHNNVFSPFSCLSSSSASHYAKCTSHKHYRWNSGSSSSSNNTTDNNVAATAEHVAKRRTRKKKKLSFSPLLQITSNHPKNTNPPYNTITSTTNDNIKLLTRKQLLRLTPKQRSNLQKHRFQQHQNSMSYLQQARMNVRSNLNYLSDTAGTNLKKNMATIQRLFRGEEEEEEVVPQLMSSSNKNQKQHHPLKSQQQQQQEKEEVGLDWERLPSELKQNVQSNIVTLQNWLHKATDGMIPSSSLVDTNDGTTTTTSSSNNSIATRVQQFHQAKQSSGLVMDRKWLAWNIALALSPGAMIGLYLYSMQDEMKEYYNKLEEQERARILGPSSSSANVKGDESSSSSSLQQQSSRNEKKKGMGISSAFVLEGGGVLDKVKMAVNDLFLGGVAERVGKAARGDVEEEEEEDDDGDDDTTKQQPPTISASTPTHDGIKLNTSTAANQSSPSESDDTLLDPTMKILLQRIESLEKQLGIEENNKGSNLLIVSEQEQQQRQQREQQQQQHFDNYIKERTFRQSPMQNRRDSSLATKWSEEEQIMKSSRQKEEEAVHTTNNNDESESTNDERSSSSITLWKFVQGVKSLLDKDVNSVKEMIRQKIGMLGDFHVTSKEDEGSEGVDEAKKDVEIAQEEEVKTVDASEKVDDVPVVVDEVVTSSSAVEKTTLEEKEEVVVVVEQAKDTQEKGFRAWISRLFRKQSGGQPEETKE